MHKTLTIAALALTIGAAEDTTAEARDAFAPRAVSLTDASEPPRFLQLVRPGKGYADLRQCGRRDARDDGHGLVRYSDTSAYRWNGRALGAQRRTRSGVSYWRSPSGGRVTFDGIVWRNRTSRAVLIAGWCG